ncbi:transglycosylase with Penicillin binding protein transpeptidase domain [Bifidobacterium actinocoloniiforme DSM 22766]|uniref:Transglycosylase with Penicillin binding protein transpeptidase domain n=1 Tax=Bifidobacterium actinocoloniiforme DSM 22766 TaxID=1437605 RepID=A0A086YZE2_9BIFI|nr:transglycosylase domain-containing protein [Bifidobacterium actinocoloniiforme]AKV54980.1 carboxypeptidase [Bifidobacterium actinocoloniiforme DSM 22766]KFI39642.1 transglycosylase with Penicillin binding protein transpeptidase domain [Bifidobacterium actinocoloniiforme DSM 22766]
MPENKKSMTVHRFLSLLLAYVVFCLAGGVVVSGFLLPGVYGVNAAAKAMMPSLSVENVDFNANDLPQQSRLYASDGHTVLATFYAQNRVVVPLKQVSDPMQKAVVAREDRRFFEHSGVDTQGVLRAFIQTYVKQGDTQGGSSLTQQYVKNVLMNQAEENNDPIAEYHAREETIARKMREMLIAEQMEKKYSKAEILQGYLNIAQFGTNTYGVETAARRYFNKSAKDLDAGEAATIAAVTKNPAKFDPTVDPKASQEQRDTVLDLMAQEGYISPAENSEAKAKPLEQTLHVQNVDAGCQAAGDAAFFCDYVTKQILNSKEFGKSQESRNKLLKEGGLDIYTTMDVNANNAAMHAARSTIPVEDPSGFEVAIAAIKPGTGEVLGFGLNRIYDATENSGGGTRTAINYAVDQVDGGGWGFQVGSTWKPINMVAWMKAGKSINQALRTSTSYPKSSFNCTGSDGQQYGFGTDSWHVENSGGGTTSPESPLQGLVRSHNTTQASMAQQIGLCSIADTAQEMGYRNSPKDQMDVHSTNSFQPTMTIGSSSASPLTMANVYATIAAKGVECSPIAIKRVIDKRGKQIQVPSANCHQAIDPAIAETTAYALNQGVVQPGGEANTTQLDGGRKTFAKTGTNEDTYMLTGGFVPQVASYVAVGNAEGSVSFNGKTINGVSRGSWYGMYIATPAWKAFMNSYLSAAGIPADNSYGNPDPRYTSGAQPQAQNGQRQQQPLQQSAQPQRQ